MGGKNPGGGLVWRWGATGHDCQRHHAHSSCGPIANPFGTTSSTPTTRINPIHPPIVYYSTHTKKPTQVKGGQHVNMVADQVVQKLMAVVKKRNKGQACLLRPPCVVDGHGLSIIVS